MDAMSPKDLAFRKELLLLKGDALRMQVRMELGVARTRCRGFGLVLGLLRTGQSLRALFSTQEAESAHGWRGWLKSGTRVALAWKSISSLWDS
jgi:hypothetical protein